MNLKNQKYAAIIILGLGLIAMLNETEHLPIGMMDYIFGAILTLLSGYTLYNSLLKKEN
ncbi:MAG: hypothetical protein JXA99_08530 [Candidatus Lokiarchaeota archaeon]|nr:hypothetical protein [Candidatus Lokiarchaeota archaeon]